MKLKDDATLSIAAAVSDVLEGKVKEEGKYPHDMFHPETGEKKVAKDEAEHKALADKGYTHDKPEVDEVAEPKAKGEKDFKAKHTIKKSGAKEDGSVVKEEDEKDEDEEEVEEAKSKFPKALLKKATDLALKMGGNMTGAVNKIEKMKKGLSDDPEVKAALQMANEEVTEEVVEEAHAMNEAKSKMQEDKERYQKFFQSALKKFGVDSPAQLKGDKKKEFFDYVDKNYEADNETDKDESVKEDTIVEGTYHNEYMFDGGTPAYIKVEIKKLEKKYPGLKFKREGKSGASVTGSNAKLTKFLLSDMNMDKGEVKDLLAKGGLGMFFQGISFKEGTIAEAFVRTFFSSDEMDNVGGDKAAKKMGIKVKVDKGKGDNKMGEDRGLFTGDEKALVKYFQDYFGFEGKNFKELKKEFHK